MILNLCAYLLSLWVMPEPESHAARTHPRNPKEGTE